MKLALERLVVLSFSVPRRYGGSLCVDYSIPRPEVVKRIRLDTRSGTSTPRPDENNKIESKLSIPSGPNRPTLLSDVKALPTKPPRGDAPSLRAPVNSPSMTNTGADETAKSATERNGDLPSLNEVVRPRSPPPSNAQQGMVSRKDPPQSPRGARSGDDTNARPVPQQGMPPPSAPSSTPSAQEFRSTAKQAFNHRGDERAENKPLRSGEVLPPSHPPSRPPSRGSGRGPSPPQNRRRSLSPVSRGPIDNRLDRPGDSGERPDRFPSRAFQTRQDRNQRGAVDTDRNDRSPRDRPAIRDSPISGARDSDRPREGDRDRERDRDRDRDRDRERDRDRDRHRRDWDKDRERDSSALRKDRDTTGRDASSNNRRDPPDDLPTGPDLSRNRSFSGGNGEDSLGKRRRAIEDDVRFVSFQCRRSDIPAVC